MSEDNLCQVKPECSDCDGNCTVVKIDTLLPCPHCGGHRLELQDATMDDPAYQIACLDCTAGVCSQESFVAAKKTWNMRPSKSKERDAR